MLVIDLASWNWPQWVLLIILTMNLVTAGVFHGRPKADYNVAITIADLVITIAILAFGGFWS